MKMQRDLWAKLVKVQLEAERRSVERAQRTRLF